MYKNILLAIDINDENSWKASLPNVLEMVEKFPDIKLHLLTVISNSGLALVEEYFPKGWLKDITVKTEKSLLKIVKDNFPKKIKPNVIVTRGVVYQVILDTAAKVDADLIVIVAAQPERQDYLLGRNASKVVEHSGISVLVVR